MLGTDESVVKASGAILKQLEDGEITRAEAIQRLGAIDPGSRVAALLTAVERAKTEGDPDAAESAAWEVIAVEPTNALSWIRLAEINGGRGPDGRAGLPYRVLALREIGALDEVPEQIAGAFKDFQDVARRPEPYRLLALRIEEAMDDDPWPEKLVPYRLLSSVQLAALDGLDPDLLRECLDRFDLCAPVFRTALKVWVDDSDTLSDEAAELLIALVGERGGPEWIDLLADDRQYPTSEVLWHAQWAIWRLGQRHPAEAFERLRAATAKADITGRGFLAEQFYLLPSEVAGRKEAILALLDGFPGDGPSEDAAYLLLTVSTLMAMLGSPYDSRAVLEGRQRRLDKEGRAWLQEAIGGETEFVPNLAEQGIEALTIEDICVELALSETEEEDGEDEDFEDDDHPPAAARYKPGRNEECWCGSGQKYKKCHLDSDEQEEREASARSALFQKVVDDIMESGVRGMNRADGADAHRRFFGSDPGMIDLSDDMQVAFMQWMMLDYRAASSGRTAIEQYLKRKGRVPESERALVDGLRNARYSIWEVQRIERGRGVEVKDYIAGGTLFINDVTTSQESAQWDCVMAYIFQHGGRWEFFSDGIRVPRDLAAKIAEMAETGARENQTTAIEYFRSRSHEWRRMAEKAGRESIENLRIANAEGDPLEFSAAIYEVTGDAEAAKSALLAAGMFAPGMPGKLVWLESPEAESGRVFGHIEIADGRLRLEANSRKRLSIGRQLVEKHAGELVRHVEDTFRSVDEVKRAAMERGPGPERPSGLRPELEREVLLKLKSQHYSTWPDQPLPALGGRTPREAVRSETGRRAVEELLRDFENGEERERRAGKPAFDFGPIREQLGL